MNLEMFRTQRSARGGILGAMSVTSRPQGLPTPGLVLVAAARHPAGFPGPAGDGAIAGRMPSVAVQAAFGSPNARARFIVGLVAAGAFVVAPNKAGRGLDGGADGGI
jgi:hypothetical protein